MHEHRCADLHTLAGHARVHTGAYRASHKHTLTCTLTPAKLSLGSLHVLGESGACETAVCSTAAHHPHLSSLI